MELLWKERRAGTLAQCAMICRTNLECGFWAQTLHEAGIPYMMRSRTEENFLENVSNSSPIRISSSAFSEPYLWEKNPGTVSAIL